MRIIINNAHNILWFLTEGRTGREVCITWSAQYTCQK
jgi:hypothetical protein